MKSVTITYGPNGVSRGIATIVFHKAASANEALVKLNGVPVDRRPMKVRLRSLAMYSNTDFVRLRLFSMLLRRLLHLQFVV